MENLNDPAAGDLGLPAKHQKEIMNQAAKLASVCEATGQLNNGRTALYFHLLHVIANHIKHEPGK